MFKPVDDKVRLTFNYINTEIKVDSYVQIYSCNDIVRQLRYSGYDLNSITPDFIMKNFQKEVIPYYFNGLNKTDLKYWVFNVRNSDVLAKFKYNEWLLDNLAENGHRTLEDLSSLKLSLYFKIPVPNFIKAHDGAIIFKTFIEQKLKTLIQKADSRNFVKKVLIYKGFKLIKFLEIVYNTTDNRASFKIDMTKVFAIEGLLMYYANKFKILDEYNTASKTTVLTLTLFYLVKKLFEKIENFLKDLRNINF